MAVMSEGAPAPVEEFPEEPEEPDPNGEVPLPDEPDPNGEVPLPEEPDPNGEVPLPEEPVPPELLALGLDAALDVLCSGHTT